MHRHTQKTWCCYLPHREIRFFMPHMFSVSLLVTASGFVNPWLLFLFIFFSLLFSPHSIIMLLSTSVLCLSSFLLSLLSNSSLCILSVYWAFISVSLVCPLPLPPLPLITFKSCPVFIPAVCTGGPLLISLFLVFLLEVYASVFLSFKTYLVFICMLIF